MGSFEHTDPTDTHSTGKANPLRYQAKTSYPSLTRFEENLSQNPPFLSRNFRKIPVIAYL